MPLMHLRKDVSGLERKLLKYWCEKARKHMGRCTDCLYIAKALTLFISSVIYFEDNCFKVALCVYFQKGESTQ